VAAPLAVRRAGRSILFVATPHKFFKEWIEENHLARIEEISRKELAEDVTVEILVGSEEEDPHSAAPVPSRCSSSRGDRHAHAGRCSVR